MIDITNPSNCTFRVWGSNNTDSLFSNTELLVNEYSDLKIILTNGAGTINIVLKDYNETEMCPDTGIAELANHLLKHGINVRIQVYDIVDYDEDNNPVEGVMFEYVVKTLYGIDLQD